MTEARIETNKPVANSHAEATQTCPHPKNLVNVSRGATLESMTVFNPASNPVASAQPMIAEITPSNKNGSWIDHDDAPTSFITPVSRRRLNAAIRKVFEINNAAVNTDARPTANAPLRRTANNLKNFSRIVRWS